MPDKDLPSLIFIDKIKNNAAPNISQKEFNLVEQSH